MNRVQIAVLGVTLAAFGGAYFLFNFSGAAPIAVMAPAPKLDMDEVLVASADVPMGTQLTEKDYSWQAWPKGAVSELMIVKSAGPTAFNEIKTATTRTSFLRGEPLRRDKLVVGPNSGFLSAVLPAGKRAVAIRIDQTGGDTAGGFILPNDRVDVIRLYHDAEASKLSGGDVVFPQTVLSNVRVLAIGQNVQEENGKKVVVGTNATLELAPDQAELIIAAENVGGGELHLVLRSLLDSAGAATTGGGLGSLPSMTIVRFGTAAQAAR